MPILVEILCDVQDERTRNAREKCFSFIGKSALAQARSLEVANRNAVENAQMSGWKKRMLKAMGRRMGWVCPVCQAQMAQDAEVAKPGRYVSPYPVTRDLDYSRQPREKRRMHVFEVGLAGNVVRCDPRCCRECWREVHWIAGQERGL